MTDPAQPHPPSAPEHPAERFACHAARLLADSRCEDVLVLDLRGLSQVTDYFVIGSGTSERQIQSVAHELKDLGEQSGQSLLSERGRNGGQWVVADFVDVVVHLFDPQHRAYYDLESLWADARRVDWEAVTQPGQFAHLGASRQTPG